MTSFIQRKNSQYFQGILQVRSDDETIISFINTQLKSKPNVFIAKVVELKNGYDLYFSSNSFLLSLGKKLGMAFGGTLKRSSSLHTKSKQTGKDLYRVTVLFKPPGYKKGDIILFDDKLSMVASLGKHTKCTDISTWKTKSVNVKGEFTILEKHRTKVVKLRPSIEVMDPETYQSTVLQNKPKKALAAGENVKVVLHNGIWIVD